MRILLSWIAVLYVAGSSVAAERSEPKSIHNELFPAGVPANHLGMFMHLDRVSEDDGAEYVQGMPIIIDIRLANVAAKRNRKNASEIHISGAWKRNIDFSLCHADGTSVRATFSPLRQNETLDDSVAALTTQDIRSAWIMEGDQTKGLKPGKYNLKVSIGPIEQTNSFVIMETKKELESKVKVSSAWASYRREEYQEAVDLTKNAMAQGGRMAHDGNNHALIIMALSYEKMGNDKEALQLLEEYLEEYVPQNPREESDLVKLKIEELKTRLKNSEHTQESIP